MLHQVQRVDVGLQVAARAVGGNQLEHRALTARLLVVDNAVAVAAPGMLRGLGDAVEDDRTRDVAGFAALELREIVLPGGVNRIGIGKPVFVKRFDVVGVAARDRGGSEELLDQAGHRFVARSNAPSAWQIRSWQGLLQCSNRSTKYP